MSFRTIRCLVRGSSWRVAKRERETLGDVGGNTNFQRNTVGASQSTVIDEATIINSQHAGTEYVSS